MIKIFVRSAALTVALGLGQQVSAEAINPSLDDQFTFRLGYQRNELEGDITISRPPLPEIPVDLGVMGLDGETDSAWLSFRWRFSEKWALSFIYDRFQEDGSNGGVLGSFPWDGEEIPVGARLESHLKADAYIINLSYAFYKNDHAEFGAGIGLHAFDLEADLRAYLMVDDVDVELTDPDSGPAADLIAPVPNLRLYGIYAFGPKTSLRADAGWLSANYDDYEGAFTYLSASVEYRFTARLGAGIGYKYTNVDLTYDPGNKKDEFNFKFDGAQVYLTYSF